MIVFASTLRLSRRPRRIPSVASLVRVLGSIRISDQPVDGTCSTADAGRAPSASVSPPHGRDQSSGPAPRSS
jgi:hypothetical protein